MILEVAAIRASPSDGDAFERAVKPGIQTAISEANGCQRSPLRRSIESPGRQLVLIARATIENQFVSICSKRSMLQISG